jgi:H/ACA ribonucleoprotein complex subunit 4
MGSWSCGSFITIYVRVLNYSFQAVEKKKLVKEGKLDKYGRKTEQTPSNWTDKYVDLQGASGNAPASVTPVVSTPAKAAPAESTEISEEDAAKAARKAAKKAAKAAAAAAEPAEEASPAVDDEAEVIHFIFF